MLVSTATLAEHISDDQWVVFDCRHDLMDPTKGREAYDVGHLPGAHFARVDEDLSGVKTGTNGRHPLPDPAAFAVLLASKGVGPGCRIVAYDDAGGQYAARLWWMCRWIGWADVAVLDGGLPKWLAEGRSLSTDQPTASTGEVVVDLQTDLLALVGEVEAAIVDSSAVVVDARAPERYRGDVEPLDPVAGHVPGALNRFFEANLNDVLTMKSPEDLKVAWAENLAGRQPNEILHQCGSGITACVNLLAMEVAGLSGSRLFAGSWSEWVGDPSRPVATGDQ